MKNILMIFFLLLSIFGFLGCATKGGISTKTPTPAILDNSDVITLECKVANPIGCRYHGRIYPWNAWVEAMGYNSKEYALKDVIPSGNKASVRIIKR